MLFELLTGRVPLPPWRITPAVLAAIFGILILLGPLAETLHRFLPPR